MKIYILEQGKWGDMKERRIKESYYINYHFTRRSYHVVQICRQNSRRGNFDQCQKWINGDKTVIFHLL